MNALSQYLLPVSLALASSVCLGQTSPSIVNLASAPVRIVSLQSTPSDMLSAVTVTNQSGKKITSLFIGLIVAVPQGCTDQPYLGKERGHDFAVQLDSDASTTVTDLKMSYVGLHKLMQRVHASDILAEIAITRVTYDTGERWTLSRSGRTYDDRLFAATANVRCHPQAAGHFTATGGNSCVSGQLLRVQGTGYNGGYFVCGTAGALQRLAAAQTQQAVKTITAQAA